MVSVETVRGPVELGNLGQTLMHEHVFVLSTEHVQNYGSGWWDEEARVADAIAKLNSLYAKGIHTIVDPTVWGLGRNIPRIQRIAAQTPVNIIVAAGLYAYEELPQQYAHRGPGLPLDIPEPMVTDFATDITKGIADTGVKAAFLKCCMETAELTPGVERIARAVARAHLETGAPITVHTSGPQQSGRTAVRIFREEGVDLRPRWRSGTRSDHCSPQRLHVGEQRGASVLGDDLAERVTHHTHLLAKRARHLLHRSVARASVAGDRLGWNRHATETIPASPSSAQRRRHLRIHGPGAPYTSPGDHQRPAGNSGSGWPRPVWAPLGVDAAGRLHAPGIQLRPAAASARRTARAGHRFSARHARIRRGLLLCPHLRIRGNDQAAPSVLSRSRRDANPHRRALGEGARARGVPPSSSPRVSGAAHPPALRARQCRGERDDRSDDRDRRLPAIAGRAAGMGALLRIQGPRGRGHVSR